MEKKNKIKHRRASLNQQLGAAGRGIEQPMATAPGHVFPDSVFETLSFLNRLHKKKKKKKVTDKEEKQFSGALLIYFVRFFFFPLHEIENFLSWGLFQFTPLVI